ncbi:YlbG family protein [Sporolactobacillus sp. CPB3-1]|uniref:YlbG family protein n=1 Tax=Sporolactobacillus mangiferae TaxID=2940498 RepID=A0ABT0M7W7_9BACL|nr:YlbG family protein [Sporolactobacillus mangiferae]MCL1630962.1 YlbG family protein [Sporolactobacillus mangiferae]
MQERDSIIVWLYHTKYFRLLRRYGYVHYISKRMKYAILYCNHEQTELTMSQLSKMKFVKAVDLSHMQEIRTTYEKGKSKAEAKDEIYN